MVSLATCAVIASEPAVRGLLACILADCGCAVVTSADGRDLDSRLMLLGPAIVFLDIAPGRTETERMLDALSRGGFQGPVQLVSGRHRDPAIPIRDAGRHRGLRMREPLRKPFDAATIHRILAEESLVAGADNAAAPAAIVRQYAWQSPGSAKSGQLDILVDLPDVDGSPATAIDGLHWWRAHGPPYLASLIAQHVPMAFCVPLSLADLATLGDLEKQGYGHIFPTPIFVLSEAEIFGDLPSAREQFAHIRRSGAMVRIVGCSTHFFSIAEHDPLAVDQAVMGTAFAADAARHRNRVRHLAEMAHRAGTLLLAEDIAPVSRGAPYLAGIDLWRAKDATPIAVPVAPAPAKLGLRASPQPPRRVLTFAETLPRRSVE